MRRFAGVSFKNRPRRGLKSGNPEFQRRERDNALRPAQMRSEFPQLKLLFARADIVEVVAGVSFR